MLEMTRYQKIAAAHVKAELEARGRKPMVLFDVTCVADMAAREAGKKRDLFESLYDYTVLLPADWTTAWLSTSDSPTADSMVYVVPVDWKSGDTSSESLLLGGGALRHARR